MYIFHITLNGKEYTLLCDFTRGFIVMKKLFFFCFYLLFSLSTPLVADNITPDVKEFLEEKSDKEIAEDKQFAQSFTRMIFSLLTVLLIFILGVMLLKRFSQARLLQGNKTSSIEILEKRALTGKSQLLIVKVEKKTFLLGETPSSLSLIDTLSEDSV